MVRVVDFWLPEKVRGISHSPRAGSVSCENGCRSTVPGQTWLWKWRRMREKTFRNLMYETFGGHPSWTPFRFSFWMWMKDSSPVVQAGALRTQHDSPRHATLTQALARSRLCWRGGNFDLESVWWKSDGSGPLLPSARPLTPHAE